MNYRLYPLTRNLDAIKRRHIEKSEQRYDNRLLRFYKNQHALHELQDAGLTNFDLHRRESKHIVQHLHRYEHVKAAICGKLPGDGRGLIVATNLRIIYLHQIPLFTNMDEVSYDLVSGVTYNQVGNWYASVTLHTRTRDYELDFVALEAAQKFADFIEKMAIDREVMKEEVATQMSKIHALQG